MAKKLKIGKISQTTLGISLPNDLVAELGLEEGDELYVVATPNGIELTRVDPESEEALEISRRAIRKFPNAMKKLAGN